MNLHYIDIRNTLYMFNLHYIYIREDRGCVRIGLRKPSFFNFFKKSKISKFKADLESRRPAGISYSIEWVDKT
jgi:hypothetical protein